MAVMLDREGSLSASAAGPRSDARGTASITAILVVLVATCALLGPAPASAQQPGAKASPTPNVVGGRIPTPGSWPYAALLDVVTRRAVFQCAGSLISARWVLTAAHCLQGAVLVDVWVGNPRPDPAAPEFTSTTFVAHPSFDPRTKANDVGLVRLPAAAPDAQARLPRPSDAVMWAPGTRALAAGWGNTGAGLSPDLLEVELPIEADAACGPLAPKIVPVFDTATMLCAGGEPGRDTCQGDSGGPLAVSDGAVGMVVGATSFGDGCGIGVPGGYARVGADPLNAWIRSIVPQAEIDVVPDAAAPGEVATLSARTANPSGPYDSIMWDLDGDGNFGDASGETAQRVVAEGANRVAVRATDSRGNDERRTIVFSAQRTPLSISLVHDVREGEPLTIRLSKEGPAAATARRGSGDVVATITPLTAQPSSDFPQGQFATNIAPTAIAGSITIPTADDAVPEPTETFQIDISSTSPSLSLTPPTQAVISILDNDQAAGAHTAARAARPLSVAVRGVRLFRSRGRVRYGFRFRASAAGTLRWRLERGTKRRRAVHAWRTARIRAAGERLISARFPRRELSRLRRARRARYELAVRFTTPAGARADKRTSWLLRYPSRRTPRRRAAR
jgi:hypothetical protein